MTRWIAGCLIFASMAMPARAQAQETSPGPGVVELSIIPGGATFFTSKAQSPDFGNYDAGAAVAFNFSRMVGVEGEVAGSFGLSQGLDRFHGGTEDSTSPNMLSYTGNVVVNASGRSVVPYATAGVGGLTVYERAELGITGSDTFFTGNVGGGVKWFAPNNRWGIRGDYRFQAVWSKDDAPAFFGRDTRYGHRIYGAVIINALM